MYVFSLSSIRYTIGAKGPLNNLKNVNFSAHTVLTKIQKTRICYRFYMPCKRGGVIGEMGALFV